MMTYKLHSPFCFTFSNDMTKSDSEPGNVFARGGCNFAGSCCDGAVDDGRAPGATFVGSVLFSDTPGGNCGGWACCAGGGMGEVPADAPGAVVLLGKPGAC